MSETLTHMATMSEDPYRNDSDLQLASLEARLGIPSPEDPLLALERKLNIVVPEIDASGTITTSEQQVAVQGLEDYTTITQKTYKNGAVHIWSEN